MNTPNNYFPEGQMNFENGVLHIEYNQNLIIDENTLYKQIVYRKSLTKEEDFFMVIDLRNDVEVTDEAVALAAANPSPAHIKAIAMITKQGIDHTRVKLYSVFDNPNIKTKAFLNIEEATLWFETLEQNTYMRKAS